MNLTDLAFSISATAFALVFLVSVIAYGGDIARAVAIGSAFLACASQFTGQDRTAYRASIYLAYGAFIFALFSYFALIAGR